MAEEKAIVSCVHCKASFRIRLPKPHFVNLAPEFCGVMLNVKECIDKCPECGTAYVPVLTGIQGLQFNIAALKKDPREEEKRILPVVSFPNVRLG